MSVMSLRRTPYISNEAKRRGRTSNHEVTLSHDAPPEYVDVQTEEAVQNFEGGEGIA